MREVWVGYTWTHRREAAKEMDGKMLSVCFLII